jgi:hypothetical protein
LKTSRKRKKRNILVKLKTLSLIACCVSFALQAEVVHIPSDGIKIGERTTISGALDNSKAIKEARLYFKSNLADTFIFVDLDKNGRVLQSNLPAPGPSMGQIDYFFAIKYQDGSFERSDVFGAKIKGEWDEDSKKAYSDVLEVQSELDPSKVTTEDFANNVAYGYQATKLVGGAGNSMNLSALGTTYTAAVAGSTAVSTTAVAAGTFGGLSMTTIGIGAAAVVGAGAAATGGSTGEDGKDVVIVNGEEVLEGEVTANESSTTTTGNPLVEIPGLGNILDEGSLDTNLPPSSAVCGTLIPGSGNIPETTHTSINLGTNNGSYNINYNLGGSISDQLVFEYDSVVIFDTGCDFINGGHSGVITLPGGGPNTLEVTMTSNCAVPGNTSWNFTVSCPVGP